MMEYVPWFVGSLATVKPAGYAMVVNPNQYDILLAADHPSSDSKPDYKPDYKEEPKPEYKDEPKKGDYYKVCVQGGWGWGGGQSPIGG